MGRIDITMGDITTQKLDAIVNAANPTLLGGGGVDGAIHRAAGPELLERCKKLAGCAPGEAKMTRGYKLPARNIVHTVGPVWQGGTQGEDEVLARCYRNSLALALEYQVRSIAFPSISTGIYGFPVDRASRIALREIRAFQAANPDMERVVIVCFDQATHDAYKAAERDIIASEP